LFFVSVNYLRQLGDIRRDPPRLVAREQLGCRGKTRLERAAVTQVNGDRLMLKGYP